MTHCEIDTNLDYKTSWFGWLPTTKISFALTQLHDWDCCTMCGRNDSQLEHWTLDFNKLLPYKIIIDGNHAILRNQTIACKKFQNKNKRGNGGYGGNVKITVIVFVARQQKQIVYSVTVAYSDIYIPVSVNQRRIQVKRHLGLIFYYLLDASWP